MHDDPFLSAEDKRYYQNRLTYFSRDRRAAIKEAVEARKTKYVQGFIVECCTEESGSWAPLKDLYAAFLEYYPNTPHTPGRAPETKILFSKYLIKLGFSKKYGRKFRPDGEFRGVYFIGLKNF